MYLEAGRKNVLHYPRYYTQHDTVSLAVGKQSPNIALQHVCTLLEMVCGKYFQLLITTLSTLCRQITIDL